VVAVVPLASGQVQKRLQTHVKLLCPVISLLVVRSRAVPRFLLKKSQRRTSRNNNRTGEKACFVIEPQRHVATARNKLRFFSCDKTGCIFAGRDARTN
jgi:hypothetical protein